MGVPSRLEQVGPESLAFHSEQAFAYHVMVTMGAWCNICDMHGKGTSVNLHANRAECSSLPTEAAKSSSCHQAASRPVGNATKPHSRRLSELGSGTSWSDAQATITRVFGELAAVGGCAHLAALRKRGVCCCPWSCVGCAMVVQRS